MHPAVRNMLLTQKVFAEGSRALAYYLATYADIAEATDNPEEKKAAEDRLALLTPIAKALMTETGVEAAKHGMQVLVDTAILLNMAWNRLPVMHVLPASMKALLKFNQSTYWHVKY